MLKRSSSAGSTSRGVRATSCCSQNGYLSSRGGCQNRWHSLVNCDHGDSTSSRFDSPAASLLARRAGTPPPDNGAMMTEGAAVGAPLNLINLSWLRKHRRHTGTFQSSTTAWCDDGSVWTGACPPPHLGSAAIALRGHRRELPVVPIDAPCTRYLRHGDPMHAWERLTWGWTRPRAGR
jgi:hypothetical protein